MNTQNNWEVEFADSTYLAESDPEHFNHLLEVVRSLLASQRETLAVEIEKHISPLYKSDYDKGWNEALTDAAAHIRKQ